MLITSMFMPVRHCFFRVDYRMDNKTYILLFGSIDKMSEKSGGSTFIIFSQLRSSFRSQEAKLEEEHHRFQPTGFDRSTSSSRVNLTFISFFLWRACDLPSSSRVGLRTGLWTLNVSRRSFPLSQDFPSFISRPSQIISSSCFGLANFLDIEIQPTRAQ